MSKAEDLSRQYVLPFLDEIYEVYGEHRQMQLSKFDGYDMMSAYEEGYHQAEKDLHKSIYKAGFLDGFEDAVEGQYENGYEQAEKDLELTWEDIPKIFQISEELKTSWWFKDNEQTKLIGTQTFWEEVLKRFKNMKDGSKR